MTEPRNPLEGKTGVMWALLDDLDDAGLEDFIAYWTARHTDLQAQGDGRGAWWCTKHICMGMDKRAARRTPRQQGSRPHGDSGTDDS